MSAYISECGYCHETQFTTWYSKRAPRDMYGRVDRDYCDARPVAFCSEEHRDAADALFDQMVAELATRAEEKSSRPAADATPGEHYPGETDMLRGLVATLRAVAVHGDLTDVQKLLAEHASDDAAARQEASA